MRRMLAGIIVFSYLLVSLCSLPQFETHSGKQGVDWCSKEFVLAKGMLGNTVMAKTNDTLTTEPDEIDSTQSTELNENSTEMDDANEGEENPILVILSGLVCIIVVVGFILFWVLIGVVIVLIVLIVYAICEIDNWVKSWKESCRFFCWE